MVKFSLAMPLPVDDVIDETYGVAVVFHEDEEEVCVCMHACVRVYMWQFHGTI